MAPVDARREIDGPVDLSGSVQRFLDGIGVGCLSVSLGAKVQHIESRIVGFLLRLGIRPHGQRRGTDPRHTCKS